MTAKQKQNIARFKAVQAEAKKLKAKNKNLTHIQAVKQAWAILYSKEKKSPSTKKSKVVKVKKTATKKSSSTGSKKLRYVGVRKLESGESRYQYKLAGIEDIKFTRINNDVNGNPRYVVHFLNLLNNDENQFLPFTKKYDYAIKKAKLIGGKKYDNKHYGGGIVFQSYNTDATAKKIIDLQNSIPKIKY